MHEAKNRGAVPSDFQLSYAYNENVMNSWRIDISCTQKTYKMARATDVANDLILADSRGLINGNGERIGWAEVCAASCNEDRKTDENTRHMGGSNCLFLDGHVKWIKSGTTGPTTKFNVGCGPWGNGRW